MYAGMSLLPIFDLSSDVALITVVYLRSGYWKSALVVWYIMYASLRFVASFAASLLPVATSARLWEKQQHEMSWPLAWVPSLAS